MVGIAHVKFPSIEATVRKGTSPSANALLHISITSRTLVEGNEKESLFESTIIPKYSIHFEGMTVDFSQLIRNPKDSKMFRVVFKSARNPSSDSFIIRKSSR